MKNGPVAAIWSCREDLVAIAVGNAIVIRPMFSRSFWTRHYRSRRDISHRPSENSGATGRSIEMKGRKQNSKSKDPFSVSAALATMVGDDTSHTHISLNGSRENIITSARDQGASMNTSRDSSGIEQYHTGGDSPGLYEQQNTI